MIPLPKPAPLAMPAAMQPAVDLHIHVRGCIISTTFHGDRYDSSVLDAAIGVALRRFNYNPTEFRGWRTLPSAPGSVAVRLA